jgi:hypothetical protein
MTTGNRTPWRRSPARITAIILGAAASVAVAIAIWSVGRHHTPAYTTGLFGAHGAQAVDLKARLGSALWCLALIQLLLGLWMYGRLPGAATAPHRVRTGHRLVGLVAFLLSVPIAYHCVLTYGVETTNARVAVEALREKLSDRGIVFALARVTQDLCDDLDAYGLTAARRS